MPTYCFFLCFVFVFFYLVWPLTDPPKPPTAPHHWYSEPGSYTITNWAEPDFQNEQILKPKLLKTNLWKHPFWKLKQCWHYVCLYLLVVIAPCTNLPLEVCCPLFTGQLVQGPPAAFWEKRLCQKEKSVQLDSFNPAKECRFRTFTQLW